MSVKSVTRSGKEWQPQYVTGINQKTCMGCGRCYKVCPRDVFDLVEREVDEDDDDFDDEEVMMVMELADEGDCIGCAACSRVCPKSCHTHQDASTLA